MKIFTVIYLFLASPLSNASSISLVLEPYLGYGPISFVEDSIAQTASGAVLGGRGGLQISTLFFALDYHTGGTYEITKLSSSLAHQMFGAGLGIIGSKWKLWFGYYPKNEWEDHAQFVEYTGTALKIGIGWTFKSKLTINIQYLNSDITEKYEFAALVLPHPNVSIHQTLLSVSAPIEIF